MKKNQFNLSVFTIAMLAVSGVQAGEVTSTFSAGGTLTAAQMTEIKDAVNDNNTGVTTNASSISTNTSNIANNTSSISTNTSGIASNTTDITSNASAIATNTSDISDNAAAIAGLVGGTQIFSVPAIVAVPRDSSCPTSQTSGGGRVGRSVGVGCGSEFMVAPVTLPNGATVTNFSCTIYDADATYDSSCFLYSDQSGSLASVSTTSDTGLQTPTTTLTAVIDNSTTGYYIYFGDNELALSTLVPINAIVEYSVP